MQSVFDIPHKAAVETLHTFAAPQAALLWRSVETATPRSPHGSRSREHTVTPTLMVENCMGPDVGAPTGPPGPAGPHLLQLNGSCQPDHFMLRKTHTNGLGWHALQPQNSKFGIATVGPASKNALHTFTPCLAKLVWRVLWRAPHFFTPSGKCAVENSSKSVENVSLVWNVKHWACRIVLFAGLGNCARKVCLPGLQ